MAESFEETGKVTEVCDDMLHISVKRHASCEKCGACGMAGKQEISFLVKNEIGAKIGDTVVIRMESSKVMKAAFLMYTIPLLFLFVGYYLGQMTAVYLGQTPQVTEAIGMISSFVMMGLTYLAIHYWDHHSKIAEKMIPSLVKIIED